MNINIGKEVSVKYNRLYFEVSELIDGAQSRFKLRVLEYWSIVLGIYALTLILCSVSYIVEYL